MACLEGGGQIRIAWNLGASLDARNIRRFIDQSQLGSA
jgi:hypothetical protein